MSCCTRVGFIWTVWISLLVLGLAFRKFFPDNFLALFLLVMVTYRYFGYYKDRYFYRRCISRPQTTTTTAEGMEPMVNLTTEEERQAIVDPALDVENHALELAKTTTTITTTTGSSSPRRIAFFDNLKSFLTALVLTHHVSCAFGGCGPYTMPLIVGLQSSMPVFDLFLGIFTLTNQAYFMPLFFFVSAYFVPASYEKKGMDAFMWGRSKRIWMPAMFLTLFLVPAMIALGQWFSGVRMTYMAVPGHAWFLFWLLLLTWVYSSIYQSSRPPSQREILNLYSIMPTGSLSSEGPTTRTTTPPSHHDDKPFPKTYVRLLVGLVFCGFFQLLVVATTPPSHHDDKPFPKTYVRLLVGSVFCGFFQLLVVALSPGSFASMPMSLGSLTCDVLMFAMGIRASRNGWFQKGPRSLLLADQLDIPPWFLTFCVLSEWIIMVSFRDHNYLLLFLVGGVFCLDMSVLLLVLFQRWGNVETRVTRFFSRASYTVYLIHPLIITGVTAAFVWAHNMFCPQDPILFKDGFGYGGGDSFLLGWIVVNLVSHALTWPLSYGLASLPVLRDIL